jgi:hypothetical protein
MTAGVRVAGRSGGFGVCRFCGSRPGAGHPSEADCIRALRLQIVELQRREFRMPVLRAPRECSDLGREA